MKNKIDLTKIVIILYILFIVFSLFTKFEPGLNIFENFFDFTLEIVKILPSA